MFKEDFKIGNVSFVRAKYKLTNIYKSNERFRFYFELKNKGLKHDKIFTDIIWVEICKDVKKFVGISHFFMNKCLLNNTLMPNLYTGVLNESIIIGEVSFLNPKHFFILNIREEQEKATFTLFKDFYPLDMEIISSLLKNYEE